MTGGRHIPKLLSKPTTANMVSCNLLIETDHNRAVVA